MSIKLAQGHPDVMAKSLRKKTDITFMASTMANDTHSQYRPSHQRNCGAEEVEQFPISEEDMQTVMIEAPVGWNTSAYPMKCSAE